MNISVKYLISDKIIRLSLIITAIMLFVLTGATIYYFFRLPPFIPLFNQLPWGMQRLSDKIGIFLPLLLSFVFFGINLLFAANVYEKMPLVSRILCITSLLIALLTFIFTARTIQLVL